MTYNFKNAIIRRPNKSIQNGLSSKNLHPKYEIIVEEHNNYVKAINDAGLKINLLEPLEEYPDSIFVEDPVITYKSNIIILNPADPSRNGEKNIIENDPFVSLDHSGVGELIEIAKRKSRNTKKSINGFMVKLKK